MAALQLYAHSVTPRSSAVVPELKLARTSETAERRASGALRGGRADEANVYRVTLTTDGGHVQRRIESVICRLRRDARGGVHHQQFLGSEI